ncbi:hypothetical protein C5167_020513 [Papaver somniferum]|uniref:Uncharacterized protein n=1 Tax=Papaver somniferum TaxID=3469 RepID=A0A4Y7IWD1_PAPSO|nr:hypothetical protein C5167_020513 [Papaver somniferum]
MLGVGGVVRSADFWACWCRWCLIILVSVMCIWIYYENGWWCWCWCDAGKGWRRESHFQGTIVTSMSMKLALSGTYPVIKKFHSGAWLLTSRRFKASGGLGHSLQIMVRCLNTPLGDIVDAVVPFMGESITDGTLAAFLKKPGDSVQIDDRKIGRSMVWKGGSCTHILEGHGDAITSVSIINQKGAKSSLTTCVATAFKDRTVRLWKFDAEEPTNNVRAFKSCDGTHRLCNVYSGSWDSTINLWRTNESDSDGDVVSVKKRKVNSKAEESQLERSEPYILSWDHSIRSWDVETGRDVLSLFCGKVLNDLDVGGDSSALIAAGSSDPVLQRLSCSLHLILPGSPLASGMTASGNIYSHQIDEPISQVETDNKLSPESLIMQLLALKLELSRSNSLGAGACAGIMAMSATYPGSLAKATTLRIFSEG